MSTYVPQKQKPECNCVKGEPSVELPLPDGIDPTKENRSICVDKCIVPVIQELLDLGIQTRGCCCGHNLEAPSVILAEECDAEDIRRAIVTTRHKDKYRRHWKILQWRMVDLNAQNKEAGR